MYQMRCLHASRLLGAFAIACVALALNPNRTVAEKPNRYFEQGIEFQRQGDLKHARMAYEAALELNPRRVAVLANLGQTLAQLGEYPQAIKYLRRALVEDPLQAGVRYQLATVYFQNREFREARDELRQLLVAEPRNYRARHLLAICLLKLNQIRQAIIELEGVCQAQPGNLDAFYALGSAYIGANMFEKAGPMMARFKAMATPEAHLLVGSYYNARKDFRRGAEELQTARRLNPELPGVDSQLGYALLFAGNRTVAAELFTNELKRNSEDFNANAFLGWLYRQDGRLEQAAVLLTKAHHMNPNNTDVLYQLALLAKSQGNLLEAVRMLRRVTEVKPDFPPAHMTLVQVYFRLRRDEDAKNEQRIIDRLQAEGKNQPTVAERQLYEVLSIPVR